MAKKSADERQKSKGLLSNLAPGEYEASINQAGENIGYGQAIITLH